MGVIPKMMTKLLGNGDLDGTVTTPGRGGSDGQDPGGGTGASGGLPEKFEQRGEGESRVEGRESSAEKAAQKFAFGELELAAVTGITQKKLAQKRVKKLREGEDWSLTPGDKGGLRVAYSVDGLIGILRAVTGEPLVAGTIAGIKLADLENRTRIGTGLPKKEAAGNGAAPGGAAALPRPDVRTATAKVRRFFANPYLVECELVATAGGGGPAASGELVVIRVRKTVNFRRGMEVPLRWEEREGRWALARREPRYPGKW